MGSCRSFKTVTGQVVPHRNGRQNLLLNRWIQEFVAEKATEPTTSRLVSLYKFRRETVTPIRRWYGTQRVLRSSFLSDDLLRFLSSTRFLFHATSLLKPATNHTCMHAMLVRTRRHAHGLTPTSVAFHLYHRAKDASTY